MPVTINGTTGITYPAGGVDNTAGAGVGTTDTQLLTNKTIYGGAIQSATSVASTSGASIDFTGIPSWVKRITVTLSGVSTSGTSDMLIQLGTSSGVDVTGYVAMAQGGSTTVASKTATAGFIIDTSAQSATSTRNGSYIISQLSGSTYVGSGVFQHDTSRTVMSAGTKTLSGTLDRVRLTTVAGTDTFDAGTINILYE